LTAKAPIWLQKDWKSWTSYGGFGYAYNPVPGRRDYWFGGDLIQKTITPALTLGAEMFFQGASAYQAPLSQNANGISSQATTTAGSRPTAIWNIGGQLNINSDFSVLFSAGHSFRGDGNSVFYIALYRTWGPGSP
jgi:hypothetical protein